MSAIQMSLNELDPKLQFLEKMLEKLSGNCSANVKVGLDGQTAEIRSANGEVIASYNSNGGGWTDTGSSYGPPLGFYSDSQFQAGYGYASGTKLSWAQVKEMARAYAAEFGERVSDGYGKTVQEATDELLDDLLGLEAAKV